MKSHWRYPKGYLTFSWDRGIYWCYGVRH